MKKIISMFNKTEELTASTLMILTSLLVFGQVILRYAFNYSITWSEELSRIMIAWFIFLGSSIAVKENAHVSMDVLDHVLFGKAKQIVNIIIDLINMAFCILVIVSGVQMLQSALALDITATSISIPMAIPYASVPVGVAFMLIRYLFKLKDDILGLADGDRQGGGKK